VLWVSKSSEERTFCAISSPHRNSASPPLSWGARTITDPKALRIIVLAFILFHASSALLEVYAFMGGVSAAIWVNIALCVLAVALFACYGLKIASNGHAAMER
jgi:hypothetical protein